MNWVDTELLRRTLIMALILSTGLSGAGCNGAASRSAGPPGGPVVVRMLESDLSSLWSGRILAEIAATVPLGEDPVDAFDMALETTRSRLESHRAGFLALNPALRNERLFEIIRAITTARPTKLQPRRPFRQKIFKQLAKWEGEMRTQLVDSYADMAQFEGVVPLDGVHPAVSKARLDLDLGNLFSGRLRIEWEASTPRTSPDSESSTSDDWHEFVLNEFNRIEAESMSLPYAMQAMLVASMEARSNSSKIAIAHKDEIDSYRKSILARMHEDESSRSRRFRRLAFLLGRIDPYAAYGRTEADWKRANRALVVGLWGSGADVMPLRELLEVRPGKPFRSQPTDNQVDRMLRTVLESFQNFNVERRIGDRKLAFRIAHMLEEPDRGVILEWLKGASTEGDEK